jgi:hypothetical protein
MMVYNGTDEGDTSWGLHTMGEVYAGWWRHWVKMTLHETGIDESDAGWVWYCVKNMLHDNDDKRRWFWRKMLYTGWRQCWMRIILRKIMLDEEYMKEDNAGWGLY